MQQYPLKDCRQYNQLRYCFPFVADCLLKGKKAISPIGKQRGKFNIFSGFCRKDIDDKNDRLVYFLVHLLLCL